MPASQRSVEGFSLERSLGNAFEQVADRHPDRIAVKSPNGIWTYGTLNRAANRLAHAIVRHAPAPGVPLALCVEQGIDEVVTVLGILKAGHPYVALAPSFPPARLVRIMEDSTAPFVVVSTGTTSGVLAALPGTTDLVTLDALDDALPVENLGVTVPPDALACISYTSGSTGEPKGVMHTHRNVLYRVRELMDRGGAGPDDRIAFAGPCSYSAFLRHVFGALLTGAALYPFDVAAGGVDAFAAWVARERVTLYASVPSVFRHFAGALTGREDLSALRMTRFFGEALTRDDVELHRRRLPAHCLLVNSLSTNETSIIAEFVVDRSEPLTGHVVPGGYVPRDKEVYLIDEQGARVGPGEVGEILIRSPYISPGYWRRPDLTAAAFLPDPEGGAARIFRTGDLGCFRADGCLEPRGRKDFRVKIRGQKVEVAEVEVALVALGFKQAVVVARDEGADGARLVAYVVPGERPAPTVSALQRALRERLPSHMMPSAFVTLDALPLNVNGKIDRPALPGPAPTRPELDTAFVAPRTPVEEVLAEIWAEALRIDRVGVDDQFLELGGHSLLATRVVSRIVQRFALDISLRELFEAATVAAMAVVVVRHLAAQVGDEVMSRMLTDAERGGPPAA